MDRGMDRRDFAKRTSIAVGSLMSGAMWGGDSACGDVPDIDDKRLVILGLNGLARAHKFNYFADGHRAASMVTAHLLCVENQMDDAAQSRIVEIFDRNWAKKPLCEPFPDTDPVPDRIAEIGLALADRGETLLQVGHNAIFAMLAIKALRMVPSAATAERIDGVCSLIRSFTPWRDVDPDPAVDPPPFSDSAAASRFVLQEASDAVDRYVGFGQGYAGHMLTFGQSLIEMAATGDEEYAESCRHAFRKYVTVTRQGPQADEKPRPDHKPIDDRPIDAKYWNRRDDKAIGIGHVFKYPYSYYDLMRRAGDSELAKQWDSKAYNIF